MTGRVCAGATWHPRGPWGWEGATLPSPPFVSSAHYWTPIASLRSGARVLCATRPGRTRESGTRRRVCVCVGVPRTRTRARGATEPCETGPCRAQGSPPIKVDPPMMVPLTFGAETRA
jgi:hypothetical protein